MNVVLTVLGIVIIMVGLWDMFQSLLRPSGKGLLSSRVLSGMWKISKLLGHRVGAAVGPAAMVVVVVMWVFLQGLGWALIYLPHMPGGFVYSSGIDPADYPDFVEALYVSLVSLATLGFGDTVATDPWIRLASPLQGLTGFALLTASLTWFIQIYPPLSHRRVLALELKSLAEVDYAEAIEETDPATVTRVLDALTAEIAKTRIDFTQHTETYYFQEKDPDLSLARQLPYAVQLCDRAASSAAPEARTSARRLSDALEHLGAKLKSDFLTTGETPEEIFNAYAHDHGQTTRP